MPALSLKEAFEAPQRPDPVVIRQKMEETRERRIADDKPGLLVFLSGLMHRFFE